MSFRTVVISNRSKLDLRMNYMVVRGEQTSKVLLDEMDVLIVENPAVSLTGCLLEALISKKVKVIFCDGRHNPQSELVPYYGSHDCSRKIRNQLKWSPQVQGQIWTMIVKEKIGKQAAFLTDLGYVEEAGMLDRYALELTYRDETNREGHAAKVYFNKIFGMDFNREQDTPLNAALDYGYSLLLSVFNREVVGNGYLTQLGFFHDNIYNPFNLSSDLMEPYRVLVDRIVRSNDFKKFETEEKHVVLEVLKSEVTINRFRQVLPNAIKVYVKSVFDALLYEDAAQVAFYER